jgi:hypothetical protein
MVVSSSSRFLRHRFAQAVTMLLAVTVGAALPAHRLAGADPTLPIQVDGTQVTLVDGLVTVADTPTFTVPFVNTGSDTIYVDQVFVQAVAAGPPFTPAEQAALLAAGIDPATLGNMLAGTIVDEPCGRATLGPLGTCTITIELPETWPLSVLPFGLFVELLGHSNPLGPFWQTQARTLLVWPAGSAPPPPPGAKIGIGDVSVLEGDAGSRNLSFPVTLSRPAATDVTVQLDVHAGTATPGTDYVAPTRARTLRFKPGQTTKTVNIPVLQDPDLEADETVSVRLSNPSAPYVLTDDEGVGTILDDDGAAKPAVGVGDVRMYEGTSGPAGKLVLPITLSSPATSEVSVLVTVYGDPSDVQLPPRPKRIRFPAGTWRKSLALPLVPDAMVEADESVTVVLSDPTSGLEITRPVGIGIIATDD